MFRSSVCRTSTANCRKVGEVVTEIEVEVRNIVVTAEDWALKEGIEVERRYKVWDR